MDEKKEKDDIIDSSLIINNNINQEIIEKINFYEKNISIITKEHESIISKMLTFLIENKNLAMLKIKIVKFLQNIFIKCEINSEIILRYSILNNNKLDIYKILIHEYIAYKNESNFIEDEISYRREILILLDILMTQLTFDRKSYHYILSFLINYLNVKNGNIEPKSDFVINSDILNRILILLEKYYHPFDISKFYGNYFFFNGDSETSIKIRNKMINKTNKRLLNLEEKLFILLFIKVFPFDKSQFSNDINNFMILKFKLIEKNSENEITVNIDINNNLFVNNNKPLAKLLEKETNYLLIKFKKKNKGIHLYLNGKKITKEKIELKEKNEIKEIILFENFIGICYNFLIFKDKCPKLILNELHFETKEKLKNKNLNTNVNKKSIYCNGFNSEELFLPFINMESKEETEQNNDNNSSNKINNVSLNNFNDFKEFEEKIISIYTPTRVIIPISSEKNNLLNTSQLIIEDSINEINAEFNTKSPTMNGVHIYKKTKNDFNQIGGLNNLLPIMEIMINDNELLTKENFEKFFNILILIFSSYYKNALANEINNNFFMFLSYFMEKIPSNFYDNNMTNVFKKISSFFSKNISEEIYILNKQYQNYILMNENILFKFHYKEQNEIIESMSNFVQNSKSGRKQLSLDIFKIIKILFHLDEKKDEFFCCKYHSEYFIGEKKIMEPELNVRLNPIKELLKHLFNEFMEFTKDKNDISIEAGNSLFQIITMLTVDISPCLQKMIINLFTECLEINYELYIDNLDQDQELLNILLFVFKNSIFDIKEDALNLIFIILKNSLNLSFFPFEKTYQFLINNSLPYFLFQDEEIIKNIISEDKKLDSEFHNDEDKSNEKEEYNQKDNNDDKIKTKIKEGERSSTEKNKDKGDTISKSEENNEDSKDKFNTIKIHGKINDIEYSLPKFNENLKKIYSLYNKKKLKISIYNLYTLVYKHFVKGTLIKLCMNLMMKFASKGDLLMISFFLETLDSIDFKNSDDKSLFEEELKNNQNLLQFLIETYFHAKLVKDSNFNKEIFVPGFDLDNCIINGEEHSIDNSLKKSELNKIIDLSQKILLEKIFEKNIYKLDFLFTWGKYYYELRNNSNLFKNVTELIISFIPEIIFPNLTDITNPEKSNLSQRRICLYSYNLLFELVTCYRLKQEDLEKYEKEKLIFQELSKNLKYLFINKKDSCKDSLKPTNVQENIDSKLDDYLLFKNIFDKYTPLWITIDKGDEKDVYIHYIKGKKNVNLKELEMMFYNFSDLPEFNEEKDKNFYVNKGIPLIYIFYHFFTLIFTIEESINELKYFFYHFRLFIILIIISSTTLTPQRTGKKKWPSEEEFLNVQNNVESIFLNLINFFINTIRTLKKQIKEYNERSQELDSNEQKNFEYLKDLYDLIIKNFGNLLKIFNNIYKDGKKREESNQKKMNSFVLGIKSIFVEPDEINKSGCYKMMEKLYTECPSLSRNTGELNNLDKITELEINIFFVKNNDKLSKKYDEQNLYNKLEENISNLIENTEFIQFFEKYSEENKKLLFPFITYISSRREAAKNIIPIYDNRPNVPSYPLNYYLVPDYIPKSSLDSSLIKSIISVNKRITKSINLDLKTCELEKQFKSRNYKKEKKRLFSFRGIWSTSDFFYNKEKYKLKYRLVNHLSSDFTRVFLTPIIDINYYLPQFRLFDENNLFRKVSSYKQIYKVTNLFFDIKKLPPRINSKKNTKNTNSQKVINEIKPETLEKKENDIESKTLKEECKNVFYYIGKEYLNFIKEDKKDDIHKYLFNEYIYKKHSCDQEYCLQSNACLVKIGFHIRGLIFNNSKGIGFYSFDSKISENEEDEGYDVDRKVCFGSVFNSQDYKYKNFFIFIPYDKIQMLFKRRYYFRRQAIEIYTEDRKSYFFKLDFAKIEYFLDNIKFHMKQDIEEISIPYTKFDEKIGFVNKNNNFLDFNLNFISSEKKFMNLRRIYEKWSKWEISTLKLLMILNIYGNRSYNDINQYPVFPWIITDYTSESFPNFENKDFIRPMEKPMGMLDFTPEAKERKENYELNWLESENEPNMDENYNRYGSHYSTCLYLTYYLVRTFPFSYIRIELQGKEFDDPNRLFNSLPTSFNLALTQKSDLRELIPEFFCFPEMFINNNELNLGETGSIGKMQLVQDVEMPLWAKKDAYIFIEKHRELLESNEIGEKINEWFNIIFGSKQKGNEAKKIKNLFNKQSYEDFEETYNKENKSEKIYRCRMVEFGVTPNQIFKNDTSKRLKLNGIQKIKQSLLFNIIKKIKKNQTILGKELIFQENKINFKDNIDKIFVFVVTEKDTKKERILLLAKNKVEVYSKDKPIISNQEEAKNDKKIDREKEENDFDMNIGEIIEDSQVKEEKEKNEEDISKSNSLNSQDVEIENKKIDKEKSKNLRFKYEKKFNIPNYRINSNLSSTILYKEGSFIALGGFWNGDILIEPLEDNQKVKMKNINIIKTGELSPITKIIIDKSETFAICTNLEGTIFVYIINKKESLIWNLHKKINEGQGDVSSFHINENLGIFIVCFKNGYNMVYTLPNCKLINSFIIEEKELNNNITKEKKDNEIDLNQDISNNIYSPNIVFISNSPLPCFIFYIRERKSLCVYSINAHFLNEYKLGYEIVNNGIIKYTDYSCRDFLFIYNPIKNTIDIHKLTDLTLIISSPKIEYKFIDFHFSIEYDSLYILVNDENSGYKILFLKPQK